MELLHVELFYDSNKADSDCGVADFVDRMNFIFAEVENAGGSRFIGSGRYDRRGVTDLNGWLRREVLFGVHGLSEWAHV